VALLYGNGIASVSRFQSRRHRRKDAEHEHADVDSERRRWLFPGADEYYRGIYTRAGLGDTQVVAVCSAISGEGKTTTSLGLGVTIAQDFPERSVLVVETDVQHPTIAEDFGIPPSPGLADCLSQGQPVRTAYRSTSLPNLHLLPAGQAGAHTGRVLGWSRMAAAVEMMRQSHDLVIVDTPALLVNSDTLLLARLADGVIFVVAAGTTPMNLVDRAIAQIGAETLRGVVLNRATSAIPRWLRNLCGL
jgi:non-specific protein-tyrosine kinase